MNKPNFNHAALRHWRDAQLLEQENRIENADQLYGLAAECALKSALNFSSTCHINHLWGKIRNHPSTDPRLTAVLNGHGTKKYNPFNDWDISQRYYADGHLSVDVMDNHKSATKDIFVAISLTGERRK